MQKLLICSTAIALALGSPAYAQGVSGNEASVGNGEIIVTAQRRAERLQDVPITITALDSQRLTQANVQQMSDIVKLTPAVRFDYQAAWVQPSIRGIGNAVVSVGAGSNVGIYTDGFYSPNTLASDFQLLSVEGIQVLKGPQGTLFGRNTTGGAILVTTAKPSTETRGVVEASYGRFDTAQIKGYVTTGLSDKVAFDLEGSYKTTNSYLKNIHPDGKAHPGEGESWSVRLGLNVELSDSVSFLLRYAHQDVKDPTTVVSTVFQDGVHPADYYAGNCVNFFVPCTYAPGDIATGSHEVSVPREDQSRFHFKGDVVQLTGSFDLGFADLTSYTQYRNEKVDLGEEQDGTAIFNSYNDIPIQNETFTQELLFGSKPGGRLQWTAGLFYFYNVDQYDSVKLKNSAVTPEFYELTPHQRTQSFAAYADLTYELVDNLFLTGGIRYSHDIADRAYIDDRTTPWFIQYPSIKTDRVTPRAVIRYQLSNASSVYASYGRGYKAGFVDVVGAYFTQNPVGEIKPEVMDAFEVGFKHASGGLVFNMSGWYYDYKNLQVAFYPEGLSSIANAKKARIYGVEGDVSYEVLPGLNLNASAAYVHAEYRDFENGSEFVFYPGAGVWGASPVDASGYRMQRTPKFTATLGAHYAFALAEGKMALSGNFYHTSGFFYDPGIQFRNHGYDLVGVRVAWTDPSDRFTVAVYGDNVLNEKYYSQVIPHAPSVVASWAAPASWGVSLKVKY